jgi:integrase
VLTGARRGELCALRWNEFNDDSIQLRRSFYRAGGETGEKSTKSGRERRVNLARSGKALLDGWLGTCQRTAAEAGVVLVDDAFVDTVSTVDGRALWDTCSLQIHRSGAPIARQMPHSACQF